MDTAILHVFKNTSSNFNKLCAISLQNNNELIITSKLIQRMLIT